jgi:HK97 gp10 family phage protein
MAEVRIRGLEGLLRRMESLPLKLQKNIIARALRKGSVPIKEDAAQRAPDDPETAGSRISESMMTVVADQTAKGAIAKTGPSQKGFFGKFAERGTRHQRKDPFLQPAFDAKRSVALDEVARVLADEIEKGLKG